MATQYFTSKDQFFVPRAIYQTPTRTGVETVTVAQESCNDGFLGFGVALTGSSCYLLNEMEQAERTTLLREVFSPEGLNLSVVRLSIGSSDYSVELYSYDDVPFDTQLEHFTVARDEAYIIPMIKQALEVRPDLYIFASPWSPPGWMKTGGQLCGGYMREEYVECYARYIVRFLQAYAAHGIPIHGLTPQNECETAQDGRMPACIWHPEIEAKFIKSLRRELDTAGLNVEIWMHDHNFSGVDRVLWMLDQINGLREACNGVAFHYYQGCAEMTLPLGQQYPELALHFTEGGPRLYENYATDWCKWMLQIGKVLQCGYKSFTGWNLMLDENGWPNIGPFSCGGLITRHSVTGELSFSGQYRALWHVARYITSESRIYRLQTDIPGGNEIHRYPKQKLSVEGVMIDNGDGHPILVMVNPDRGPVGTTETEGRRTQVLVNGTWWYIELMPESVTTVIL